jgi:hypothetical protein
MMKECLHTLQAAGMMTLGAVMLSLAGGVSVVMADTISSPNYSINGNLGGSFGGSPFSTNYKMTSIGGEAIVGSGQSGSYIIDQRPPGSSTTSTMQLAVQPGGLVAYYPFDEGTGTLAADASANNNNGSLVSGPTWTTGKLNSAASFDGSNGQSVSIADNAQITMTTQMTLSLWAKQSAATTNKALASHWDYVSGSHSGAWALQTESSDASRLQFFVANAQTDTGSNYIATNSGTWSSGAWHHIVIVYDGSQVTPLNRISVYIDNVKVGTTMAGTIPTSMQNAASPMMIGDFNGLNRTWNGQIDHVKLFNRALSQQEVSAEYTAQNAGTPAGLAFGALTSGSTTSLADAIVRTNVSDYGLSIQQDHNLQSGANTISPVSGSIASPSVWSEGTTKGLGFTVWGAPTLDSKWGSGANYAAIPSSATTFYSAVGHATNAIDVINVRLRLDVPTSQVAGAYSNTVTYTGTTLP